MKLITACTLTDDQKRLTEELAALCREQDGSTLSFPSEDGNFFVLIFDEGILACALALYSLEPGLLECDAFTRPEMRCGGLFSRALDCARKRFPGDDFVFPSDGCCPAAAFVLKKLNARYWYCEHMMRLDFSGWQPPVCVLPPAFSMEEDTPGHFIARIHKKEAGVCSIMNSGPSVYLWGLEIRSRFRGKGYGKAFFLQVLKKLEQKAPSVLLQVSGDNTAALNLYKKTGFRIVETLSYYLY